MFILSFLGNMIEIGGGLFLCYYLIQDYRSGWTGFRSLIDKGPELLERMSFGFLDGNGQGSARRHLKKSAQDLHLTRENVAQVQAIAEKLRKQEQESGQLVREAGNCAEKAARNHDEIGIHDSVMQKLAHQERVTALGMAAEDVEQSIPELLQHIQIVELQHQQSELRLEGMQVNDSIAAVTEQVYQLISTVGPDGYTDHAELAHIEDESENRRAKAGKMLQLVRGKRDQRFVSILKDEAIVAEIEAVKSRVAALPAPSSVKPESIEYDHANGRVVEGGEIHNPEIA